MIKNWIRKYFLKVVIVIYIIATASFLFLQLENNYRKNLVNYGMSFAEDKLITQIIETFRQNPCEIIQLEKSENTVEIISKDCAAYLK